MSDASNEKRDDESKALRDEGMSSPTDIRNAKGRRKEKDMPEDEGYKKRDPEQDYRGPAKKDH